jgi:hypothetical protein
MDPTQEEQESLALWGVQDASILLSNYADLAYLLKRLDRLIAMDSAVAHLAGSMGVSVWVLLAHSCAWCWGTGSEHTPWYPTVRLFRQRNFHIWDGCIQSMSKALIAELFEG